MKHSSVLLLPDTDDSQHFVRVSAKVVHDFLACSYSTKYENLEVVSDGFHLGNLRLKATKINKRRHRASGPTVY